MFKPKKSDTDMRGNDFNQFTDFTVRPNQYTSYRDANANGLPSPVDLKVELPKANYAHSSFQAAAGKGEGPNFIHPKKEEDDEDDKKSSAGFEPGRVGNNERKCKFTSVKNYFVVLIFYAFLSLYLVQGGCNNNDNYFAAHVNGPKASINLEPVAQVRLPSGALPVDGCIVSFHGNVMNVVTCAMAMKIVKKRAPRSAYRDQQEEGKVFLHQVDLRTGQELKRVGLCVNFPFVKPSAAALSEDGCILAIRDDHGVHFFNFPKEVTYSCLIHSQRC